MCGNIKITDDGHGLVQCQTTTAKSTALAQTETMNYVINIKFPSVWSNSLVYTVTS